MASISHESTSARPERESLSQRLLVPEMWASLAISVIWLAVLFDALLGPNIVSSTPGGTTSVPSAVVVVVFAYLATHAVARYGFRHGPSS